jgi:hypothetical protein
MARTHLRGDSYTNVTANAATKDESCSASNLYVDGALSDSVAGATAVFKLCAAKWKSGVHETSRAY